MSKRRASCSAVRGVPLDRVKAVVSRAASCARTGEVSRAVVRQRAARERKAEAPAGQALRVAGARAKEKGRCFHRPLQNPSVDADQAAACSASLARTWRLMRRAAVDSCSSRALTMKASRPPLKSRVRSAAFEMRSEKVWPRASD
ncbi:hypothetical protein D3C73_1271430 [compost metagenome]